MKNYPTEKARKCAAVRVICYELFCWLKNCVFLACRKNGTEARQGSQKQKTDFLGLSAGKLTLSTEHLTLLTGFLGLVAGNLTLTAGFSGLETGKLTSDANLQATTGEMGFTAGYLRLATDFLRFLMMREADRR